VRVRALRPAVLSGLSVGLALAVLASCADLRKVSAEFPAMLTLQRDLAARFHEPGVSIKWTATELRITFVNSRIARLPEGERAATARRVGEFVRDHFARYGELRMIVVGFQSVADYTVVSYSEEQGSYRFSPEDLAQERASEPPAPLVPGCYGLWLGPWPGARSGFRVSSDRRIVRLSDSSVDQASPAEYAAVFIAGPGFGAMAPANPPVWRQGGENRGGFQLEIRDNLSRIVVNLQGESDSLTGVVSFGDGLLPPDSSGMPRNPIATGPARARHITCP
jgi:hypothetical protein